jgi:hypothetical protein
MDIRTEAEHDTDIPTEPPEAYEPPMLDEIGGFTALTRLNNRGRYADADGYYS